MEITREVHSECLENKPQNNDSNDTVQQQSNSETKKVPVYAFNVMSLLSINQVLKKFNSSFSIETISEHRPEYTKGSRTIFSSSYLCILYRFFIYFRG